MSDTLPHIWVRHWQFVNTVLLTWLACTKRKYSTCSVIHTWNLFFHIWHEAVWVMANKMPPT